MNDLLVDDGYAGNRPIVHQNNNYYMTKPANPNGFFHHQSSMIANHTLVRQYMEADPYTRRTRECGDFKSSHNGLITKYCKNMHGSWEKIGTMTHR